MDTVHFVDVLENQGLLPPWQGGHSEVVSILSWSARQTIPEEYDNEAGHLGIKGKPNITKRGTYKVI